MAFRFGCLATFAFTSVYASTASTLCRCTPDQSCWPSNADWISLNSSINGNLRTLRPLANVCHDPSYDAAACEFVLANTHESSFRAAQPGALQYQNWESWPEQNQQCYVETAQTVPCGQGRVSLYSAEVESAQHIQAAVRFASTHNLRLAVKNSGHDFLGRSSAPESLQVATYKLNSMSVIDDFVPSVPSGTNLPAPVKAVTVGAGVLMHDLYAFLGSQQTMVVGGSSNTVGISGGYIQGGGHSIMGWLHGMASDNALEFELVTADGLLVIANAYENSDLFWALRGGGGGSFGIVVSTTVKAYPDYPVIFTQTNYTLAAPNAAFWKGVEVFNEYLITLNNYGLSGYFYATPMNPVSEVSNVATFVLYMWAVNQTDTSAVNAQFNPLLRALQSVTGTKPFYEIVPFPSMSSMYATIYTGNDTTGLQAQLGSRLISRDFISSTSGPAKLASALSTIKVGPGDYLEGNLVGGGEVAANTGISSALNPAWRKTINHMLFTRQWSATTTFAEQAVIKNNITQDEVPILKSLEPGQMGAYVNEADANEVDFQESFWGDNYSELLAIKTARDPRSLFITRRGVGSEYWDEDGLCRISAGS